MEWWQKLRRAWTSIAASFKELAKGKCVKNESEGIEKGLLNLREEVETCEYEDVHVMWDILNQLQAEQEAIQADANASKNMKKTHSWRTFFCSFSLLH